LRDLQNGKKAEQGHVLVLVSLSTLPDLRIVHVHHSTGAKVREIASLHYIYKIPVRP